MRSISLKAFCTLVTLACLVFVAPATAQTVRTNNLETYRTTYDAAAARISADIQRQKADALAQYGKNLNAILSALKQRGDIDGYAAVEHEAKRFQADKTILTNAPASQGTPAIAAYQKQTAAADAESTRRKMDLQRKYILALNSLVKTLMAQDKIADAKAVGDEKHSAEMMLSEIEAGALKAQVPSEPSGVRPQVAIELGSATPQLPIQAGHPAVTTKKLFPEGTVEYKGHHYLIVLDAVTWDVAKSLCEDMGGRLVCFETNTEREHIWKTMMGQPTVWIGASIEGVNWEWVNGSRVDIKGLGIGGDLGGSQGNVAEWFGGERNEIANRFHGCPMNDKHPFICEWDSTPIHGSAIPVRPVVASPQTKTELARSGDRNRPSIPPDANPYGGHHYLHVKVKTDWDTAKAKCEEVGGHLVTIADAKELQYVGFWLIHQYYPQSKGSCVWIGLRKDAASGKFNKWVDGSPVRYTGWHPKQPVQGSAGTDFVFMGEFGEFGTGWKTSLDTDDSIVGYVCEWEY